MLETQLEFIHLFLFEHLSRNDNFHLADFQESFFFYTNEAFCENNMRL